MYIQQLSYYILFLTEKKGFQDSPVRTV